MSNPTLSLTKTYVADAAIARHRIVKFGATDGAVAQADGATAALLGISTEIPAAAAERVDVYLAGLVDVEYGGNVTRGDLLTSDANGKAIKATRHTHTENAAAAYEQNANTSVSTEVRTIGIAMVSGVAGDIGSCHIQLGLI